MTMMSSLKALLFATPAKGAAALSGGATATPGDAFAALLGGMTGDAADVPMTDGEAIAALPAASVQPTVPAMPEAIPAPDIIAAPVEGVPPMETPPAPAQLAHKDAALPAAPLPRPVDAPVADNFPAAMPAITPVPVKRSTPTPEPAAVLSQDAAVEEAEPDNPATAVESDGEIEERSAAPTSIARSADAVPLSVVIPHAPQDQGAATPTAIAGDAPVSRPVQPSVTIAPTPAALPKQDAAVPAQHSQEPVTQAPIMAASSGVRVMPEAGPMPVSPVPAPAEPAPTSSARVADAPMPPSSASVAVPPMTVGPEVVEGNVQAIPTLPRTVGLAVPDTMFARGESAPEPSSTASVAATPMTVGPKVVKGEAQNVLAPPKATAPEMPVAVPRSGNGEATPPSTSAEMEIAVQHGAPDAPVPAEAITPMTVAMQPEVDGVPAPAPQAPAVPAARIAALDAGSTEAGPVQATPIIGAPLAASLPPAAAVADGLEARTRGAPVQNVQPVVIPPATPEASIAAVAPAAPASPMPAADSGIAPDVAAPSPAAAPARSEALSLLQLVRDHFVGRDKETASPRPVAAAAQVRHGEAFDVPQSAQGGATNPVIAPVAPPTLVAAQPAFPAPAPVDLGGTLATQVVDMGVSGQWIDSLARDIAGLSARGAQGRFEVQAGQLGPVQVDIRPGAAGASVSLTVASDAAQQALQADSDRLIADASLSALRIAEVRVDRAPLAEAARADTAAQQQSSQQQSSQQNGSQGQSQQGQGPSGGQSHGFSQNLSQGAGQNRPQNRENLSGNHKAAGESAVLPQADSRDARGDGLRRSAGRARYA